MNQRWNRHPPGHRSSGSSGDSPFGRTGLQLALPRSTRVSPGFCACACNPVDPPPVWPCLHPLTRTPESTDPSIRPVEIMAVECAWRWVPIPPPPAARLQRKSDWRALLEAVRGMLVSKRFLQLYWALPSLALLRGVSRKSPSPEFGWRSRSFRPCAPAAPGSQRFRNLSGQWGISP